MKTSIEREARARKGILATGLVLLAVYLVLNAMRSVYGCFNGYDFGIYGQAIVETSRFVEFNPYLTVRGTKAFNDHFNPILYVPAAFTAVFGFSTLFMVVFEWLTYAAGFLIAWSKSRRASLALGIAVAASVVAGRGPLNAIDFPVHVDFWAYPFFMLWALDGFRGRWGRVAAWSAFLCLFKESFCFVIFTFGALVFATGIYEAVREGGDRDRKRGWGALILAIGLASGLFNFWLRPIVFGHIHGHGNQLAAGLFAAPFAFVGHALAQLNWNIAGKVLGPPLATAIVALSLVSGRKEKWKLLLPVVALMPLAAIHVFANMLGFQYGFPYFAVATAMLIALPAGVRAPRRFALLTALFVLTGMAVYTSAAKRIVLRTGSRCEMTDQRRADLRAAKDLAREADAEPGARQLATGGIVTDLLAPGRAIYHMTSHGDFAIDGAEWVFLERAGYGDAYPLGPENAAAMEACMRKTGKIRYESAGLLVAQGAFPDACWKGGK